MRQAKYESLEPFVEEFDNSNFELHASYTPENGIRIAIKAEYDNFDFNRVESDESFDLSKEQAIELGEALLRWAGDNHGFERTNEQ